MLHIRRSTYRAGIVFHKTRYGGIYGTRISVLGNNSKCIPNKGKLEVYTAKCSSAAQSFPSIGPSLEMCITGVNVAAAVLLYLCRSLSNPASIDTRRGEAGLAKKAHFKSVLPKAAHQIYLQEAVLVTIHKHTRSRIKEIRVISGKSW